jgi:hypothetical protein
MWRPKWVNVYFGKSWVLEDSEGHSYKCPGDIYPIRFQFAYQAQRYAERLNSGRKSRSIRQTQRQT